MDSPAFTDAKKWVDSLGDKWRLQILSKRFRIDPSTGVKTELPTRIRRFVEGCPWALVDQAVRYLVSQAPYKGVIYNGVPLEGEYNPTLTTWKRDDQDEVVSPAASRRNDGTYTLIQDLIEAGDVNDAYGARSSIECAEEVVTRWVWDSGAVEELPTSTEQGVSYAITSVSRNEDGTFNYALVKRTSKPQFGGWSVKRDDEEARVEVWHGNNLRGAPNSWEGMTIPSSELGKSVDVDYQQNDDCTYRVTVTVTTAKASASGGSCLKDQFRHQHVEEKSGQASPLGDAPEPSGGVVTRHSDKRQPDGTFRTEKTVETELPVSESVVEVRRGRRGTRRSVTDTNQESPAPLSLDVGGSVRVEKTPGKLYNNTVVTWIRSVSEKVASVCKFDIFSHSHSETKSGLSSLPSGDVPKASGGVIHTRRADMDDEGSITQTDETETEQPVKNAIVKYVVGLRGVRRLLTHRNVSDTPSAPPFSKANIGRSVTVEKTPGGLNNVTEEEIDRSGAALDTGSSCEKTVFEHSHTKTKADPAGTVEDSHVTAAGGGHYHKKVVELDESGATVSRETDVDELQLDDADVEIRRTAKAIIKRATVRNTSSAAQEPSNIGETQSHTTNPGGSRNLTVVTMKVTGKPSRSHCEKTIFEHVHDTEKSEVGDSPDTTDVEEAGGGVFASKDSVVDEQGIITTTTRKHTEVAVEGAEKSFHRTTRGLVTTTLDKNQRSPVREPPDDGSHIGVTNSYRKNPGGSFDNTTQVKSASARPDYGMADENAFRRITEVSEMNTSGISISADSSPSGGTGTGGVSSRDTQDIDSEGFRKTVKRVITEKSVADGNIGESNLRFTSTTISTHNNPSQANVKTATVGGPIFSWTSKKTEGGNYDTIETEKKPTRFRSFSISSSSRYHIFYQTSFFNATASDVVSVGNSVGRNVETLLAGKTNKYPSGFGMHCSANMNEFGLFDGYVAGTATYGPFQEGNGTFGSITLTSTSTNVQPIWDSEINRLKGNIVERMTYEITSVYGYGLAGLNYRAPTSGDVYSTRAEYSPMTNCWTLTYSKIVKHMVEFVPVGSDAESVVIPESA